MKVVLLIIGILALFQSVSAHESFTEKGPSSFTSIVYKCVSSSADEVSELTLTGGLIAGNWQLKGKVKLTPLSPWFPLNFPLSENENKDGLVGTQDMVRLGRYLYHAQAFTQDWEFTHDLIKVQVGWGYDPGPITTIAKMICIASE